MTREQVLSKVLDIYREIEDLQEEIDRLYRKAQGIEEDDHLNSKDYLDCIKSYTNF